MRQHKENPEHHAGPVAIKKELTKKGFAEGKNEGAELEGPDSKPMLAAFFDRMDELCQQNGFQNKPALNADATDDANGSNFANTYQHHMSGPTPA